MPPVGQKRASGKGPANDLSMGIPPAAPAGKNLKQWYPAASPLISSEAVATAGRYGIAASGAAANKAGVVPGEIAKAAPALAAECRSETDSTVPAPTQMPVSAREIASMAASAAGVRSVTS